jgi:hypothetical protein
LDSATIGAIGLLTTSGILFKDLVLMTSLKFKEGVEELDNDLFRVKSSASVLIVELTLVLILFVSIGLSWVPLAEFKLLIFCSLFLFFLNNNSKIKLKDKQTFDLSGQFDKSDRAFDRRVFEQSLEAIILVFSKHLKNLKNLIYSLLLCNLS